MTTTNNRPVQSNGQHEARLANKPQKAWLAAGRRLSHAFMILAIIVAAAAMIWPTPGQKLNAAGLYTQLVLPFDSVKTFSYDYNKAEHALILELAKTSPSELGALDTYDERLIKRVLIKDLGPTGSEIKLILRDRNVRAIVSQFNEPFRISIDIFDADYSEEKDPVTGMPLTAVGKGTMSTSTSPAREARLETQAIQATQETQETASESPLVRGVTSSETPTDSESSGKRRLLQPMPPVFTETSELNEALAGTADGTGKSWSEFPPYVYRLQTAAYEAGGSQNASSQLASEAVTSARAMADYAGKLFNLGHESRALIAYQQVLQKDPSIFDKDALHLWKFAEIHLGQGNYTLARGYFQSLVEKHPESPLANFARLRLLDISAIKAIAQDQLNSLPTLVAGLAAIKPRTNGELPAQVAIRKAFWSKTGLPKTYSPAHLPQIDPTTRADLAQAYPAVENSKTAFITASLLLNDMVRSDTAWSRASGPFADSYFSRFSGKSTEDYRNQLKDRLFVKLNNNLQGKVTDGKLVEAIEDFEALPRSLQSIKKTPATSWALAEAYRKLGQDNKAVDLYAAAAGASKAGPDRFKAQFWLAVSAGNLAQQSRDNPEKASRLAQISSKADKDMAASWDELKPAERQQISTAYKEAFEKTVSTPTKLRTPLKIVLANWTEGLATKTNATNGGEKTDWNRNFSPSGSTVMLLSDLAKRFSELGMTNERRQSLSLLKTMKPSDFEDDKAARDIWAKELLNLAEDYRKANQNLDAGRIYALVGTEAENFPGRAEALYKGGLLLYSSGRREEALEAFKKARDDGNNLFYANLARERLSQLE